MSLTIASILKAPEALRQELEKKSNENATKIAQDLVNGNFRNNSPDDEIIVESSIDQIAGVDRGSNWGSEGW